MATRELPVATVKVAPCTHGKDHPDTPILWARSLNDVQKCGEGLIPRMNSSGKGRRLLEDHDDARPPGCACAVIRMGRERIRATNREPPYAASSAPWRPSSGAHPPLGGLRLAQ